MADPNLYHAGLRVPAPDGPGLQPQALPPSGGLDAAFGALGKFGDAAGQVYARVDHARKLTAVAEATTDHITAVDALKERYSSDQDWQTAPERFARDLEALELENSDRIADHDLRARARLEWRRTGISAGSAVRNAANGRASDAELAALDARLPVDVDAAADLQRSPVERAAIADGYIGSVRASGWLSEQAKLSRSQKFLDAVGLRTLERADDNLQALRGRIASASDAAAVSASSQNVLSDGEALIDQMPLAPQQREATLRAWRRQVADAGFSRLAVVDPAAARIAGGRGGPGDAVVDAIVQAESGGRADAANPNSSALGAGQFTNATWLDMIATYRPELTIGKNRAEILALRTDPTLSRAMVERYAEQNAAHLRARGLPVTGGNIYLAHFLGPAGAAAVLSVDPGTPVDRVLAPEQIAANARVLDGKTAGEVAEWAAGKIGRAAATAGPPGDPQFGAVSYERRVAILDAAETGAARAAAASTQQSERVRQAQSAAVLKEAYVRSQRGELTAEFVEQARALVTPAEYKNLLTALGAEAAADDPDAMIDLTRRIDTDDPQEFQRQGADYLRRGKLKTATFLSLSEKNRSARRDDAPASPYRSGRDLVKSALEPGMFVTGAARAPFAQAQATGLTEFDNWAQANPQADRAATLAAAQDILQRHQVVDMSQARIVIGTSRYFGGRGREAVTIEVVEAAEEALLRDIDAGLVTPAQVLSEARRFNNYRAIIEREQAAREAPRARSK